MKKYVLISMLSLFFLCSTGYAELADNGNGTVTDTETGLMWQQDESGAMTWEEALNYCEDLDLAGYEDWRLPNRNELQSIVDYTRFNPAMDRTAFPGAMSSGYWSSTTIPHPWDTHVARLVFFNNGGVSGYPKLDIFYVRAVRNGQ